MLLQNNGLTACVAAVFWMVGTLGCGEESSDSSDMADAAVDVEVNTDGDDSDTGTATMDTEPMVASACTVAASEGMRTCVRSVNTAWTQCFANGDAPCAPDNAEVSAALMTLQGRLEADCEEGAFGALSTQALVGRLRNACRSEAASLAWRTYGGPQGAVWAEATDETKACLTASHAAAATLMDDGLGSISACLTEGNCDPTTVEADRQMSAGTALSAIAEGCSTGLDTLIAVTPEVYLDRAAHQVDCMAAAAHAQTAPLALKCGPSFAAFDPPRGEYIQVTVDGDVWGTQCGDGSPYVFHVRLAPEGERLDRLVIGLQGGGVCVFGSDCGPRLESNPGLFTAMDDEPPTTGITSNDPDESPFARWTKVYLPYCNQDVFAGGGVVEAFENGLEVPRYGSINMRAAVQMVRDVLWKLMDAEGGAGYRPDEVVALFGGWSAGGYGALYNYHWFLDDLQWPRTAAFPDAGLALDNNEALGVRALGAIKIPAWGMQANLPPYCFSGDCALGPVIYEAIAPRLRQVPEQQMLIVSNPRDLIQQGDAYFGGDEARWINALRQSYCDTRELGGIHYYFTSVSDESVHVVSLRPELWSGEVDGESMRDWFERAVNEPSTLMDRVEEADFIEQIPGVQPFPCAVAP